MFLKNKKHYKIRRSKVTDYAALLGGCTALSESTHVKTHIVGNYTSQPISRTQIGHLRT